MFLVINFYILHQLLFFISSEKWSIFLRFECMKKLEFKFQNRDVSNFYSVLYFVTRLNYAFHIIRVNLFFWLSGYENADSKCQCDCRYKSDPKIINKTYAIRLIFLIKEHFVKVFSYQFLAGCLETNLFNGTHPTNQKIHFLFHYIFSKKE